MHAYVIHNLNNVYVTLLTDTKASAKAHCYKYCSQLSNFTVYSGKVWQGKSLMIRQTKTIQISTYNYNLLAKSIHLPNFFSPNARNK